MVKTHNNCYLFKIGELSILLKNSFLFIHLMNDPLLEAVTTTTSPKPLEIDNKILPLCNSVIFNELSKNSLFRTLSFHFVFLAQWQVNLLLISVFCVTPAVKSGSFSSFVRSNSTKKSPFIVQANFFQISKFTQFTYDARCKVYDSGYDGVKYDPPPLSSCSLNPISTGLKKLR